MSATQINTHLAKNIEWTIYRNGHNELQLALTLNGAAYDSSALNLTARFRTPDGSEDKLTLAQDDAEITNGGATGLITIPLTEAQIETIPRDRYFIVVDYPLSGKTYPLVTGFTNIVSETNPGTTTTTATIPVNISGTTVNMSVTLISPPSQVTTNTQTDSYTLVLADAGKMVEMNKATANNLTVPPNSSVAFPIGTQILIAQYGAGQTTVVAGSGVTIRSASGQLKMTGQYSAASLTKRGTNEWYLFGDLTA